MDEDIKVEKFRLEDGRHAEKHVRDSGDEEVVEVYSEPERELKLSKRLINKKRPVVFERAIETFDKDGNVVNRQVESIDPEPKLEVRSSVERLKAQHEVDADERAANNPKKFVSRDELKDALTAVVNIVRDNNSEPARKFSAVAEVEERVTAAEKPSWKAILAVALIIAEGLGLAYVAFWM